MNSTIGENLPRPTDRMRSLTVMSLVLDWKSTRYSNNEAASAAANSVPSSARVTYAALARNRPVDSPTPGTVLSDWWRYTCTDGR
jgi:hypothetical protein